MKSSRYGTLNVVQKSKLYLLIRLLDYKSLKWMSKHVEHHLILREKEEKIYDISNTKR